MSVFENALESFVKVEELFLGDFSLLGLENISGKRKARLDELRNFLFAVLLNNVANYPQLSLNNIKKGQNNVKVIPIFVRHKRKDSEQKREEGKEKVKPCFSELSLFLRKPANYLCCPEAVKGQQQRRFLDAEWHQEKESQSIQNRRNFFDDGDFQVKELVFKRNVSEAELPNKNSWADDQKKAPQQEDLQAWIGKRSDLVKKCHHPSQFDSEDKDQKGIQKDREFRGLEKIPNKFFYQSRPDLADQCSRKQNGRERKYILPKNNLTRQSQVQRNEVDPPENG